MTLNFPGPFEVRLFYTVPTSFGTLQHQQRLNCQVVGDPAPGTAMSSISMTRPVGANLDADVAIDAWVNLIKAIFSSIAGATTIDYAELWKYDAGTFDANFISAYDIAVAGTSGSQEEVSGQCILVFRTSEGGIMKVVFMESVVAAGVPDTLPLANTNLDAIADSLIAGEQPWIGRDEGAPIALIAMYPGQSEAVFKRHFRP